jgi:hypothetical protein
MPPKKGKSAAAAASVEPDVPAPLDSGRVESGATPAPKRAAKSSSQTNTLAAQKSTLMGPPQLSMTARSFNESPAVAPATWPDCASWGVRCKDNTPGIPG